MTLTDAVAVLQSQSSYLERELAWQRVRTSCWNPVCRLAWKIKSRTDYYGTFDDCVVYLETELLRAIRLVKIIAGDAELEHYFLKRIIWKSKRKKQEESYAMAKSRTIELSPSILSSTQDECASYLRTTDFVQHLSPLEQAIVRRLLGGNTIASILRDLSITYRAYDQLMVSIRHKAEEYLES